MEFDELKTFLMQAQYTDKQLREIKAIADIRLGNFSSREASLRELGKGSSMIYTQLFYDQLRKYLGDHCKISTMPLSVLRSTNPKLYKDVSTAATFLYSVAEDWNVDKIMQRNFVVGVYFLYDKLVVSYLQDCTIPVSVKTALQHTDKFVGLVDKAYPDYVKNGLIKMVILGPSKAYQ